MNDLLLMIAMFWILYSGLTIYGICKFPAYDFHMKAQEILLVVVIPAIGSYLANRNMGYRFSEAAKKDLTYELPWWASFSMKGVSSELDDD